jgi:adenylyl-sulfate kinase
MPVYPSVGKVSREERSRQFGQRPLTVWLTGLSGAGKSTLGAELERRLMDAGRPCYLLDGDNVRAGISRDLGFGPASRKENIRRVAEIARLLNDAGLIALSAFISPYRADRRMAREIIGADSFLEVYLSAPLEVCEQRDPKGLYRKARAAQIAEFTGVSAPYESPQAPDLVLATGTRGIEECVAELLRVVTARLRPA